MKRIIKDQVQVDIILSEVKEEILAALKAGFIGSYERKGYDKDGNLITSLGGHEEPYLKLEIVLSDAEVIQDSLKISSK